MNRNARIISSGMYAPERILPNSFFNELLGEDVDTWLVENLTIKERRWCAENESTADLCEAAARETLKNAGLRASNLDLIIVATDTPEYISPSTASVVQHKLGALGVATFDINSACAGFVTGLDIGLGNKTTGNMKGVQFGLFNSVDENQSGWQDGLINLVKGKAVGLQTGLYNSSEETSGIQVGLLNKADKTAKAFQLGIINHAGKISGLQIGLLYNSTDSLNGVQIGLLNFNWTREPIRFFPFVNIGY